MALARPVCDACHSPSIGSTVMATATKVAGQPIAAWRVLSVFLVF